MFQGSRNGLDYTHEILLHLHGQSTQVHCASCTQQSKEVVVSDYCFGQTIVNDPEH